MGSIIYKVALSRFCGRCPVYLLPAHAGERIRVKSKKSHVLIVASTLLSEFGFEMSPLRSLRGDHSSPCFQLF